TAFFLRLCDAHRWPALRAILRVRFGAAAQAGAGNDDDRAAARARLQPEAQLPAALTDGVRGEPEPARDFRLGLAGAVPAPEVHRRERGQPLVRERPAVPQHRPRPVRVRTAPRAPDAHDQRGGEVPEFAPLAACLVVALDTREPERLVNHLLRRSVWR